MAHRISVTEQKNSFGQQVFAFDLPKGRTLKLEFCQHLIDPSGDPCCVVANLYDEQGQRVEVLVAELGGKKQESMKSPSLWFSTQEEEKRHGDMIAQELDVTKEEIAPIIKAIDDIGGNNYRDN